MSDQPKSPEEIPSLFVEAWNQRNALGIADLFAEDAEFVNVVGLWWHNRHDIFKAHDYGLKVIFKDSHLELRKTKVKMLSEDIALVHARMKLSGQTGHGDVNQPYSRQNILSFVVKRSDNRWLCESAHNTDIVPGAETNIINEKGEITGMDYRK